MPIPPPTARNARIEANWPTITAKNKPAMVVHTRGLRILGLTAGSVSRTGSQVSKTRGGSEAIVEIIAGAPSESVWVDRSHGYKGWLQFASRQCPSARIARLLRKLFEKSPTVQKRQRASRSSRPRLAPGIFALGLPLRTHQCDVHSLAGEEERQLAVFHFVREVGHAPLIRQDQAAVSDLPLSDSLRFPTFPGRGLHLE